MVVHFNDSRILLIPLLVILAVIISTVGYGWIVNEEARAGGMSEKFEMPVSETYQPNLDCLGPNGTVLFVDSEHHWISLVDQDGRIEWTLEYDAELICYQIVDSELYFVDVSTTGQYALNCYGIDGVWKSTTLCQPIFYLLHGEDGRIYASGSDENYTTIYCIENGVVEWSYTQNDSLVVDNVWSDGRCLLSHTLYTRIIHGNSHNMISGVNERIMMSHNGTPEWKLSNSSSFGEVTDAYIADNGTIVLYYEGYGVKQYHGYSLSGTLIWTNTTFNLSCDSNNFGLVYFGSQPWGGNAQYDYVEAVFKEDRNNASNCWMVLLNGTMGGSMHNLNGMEIFVSNDGEAYGLDANGSILWHIQTGFDASPETIIEDDLGLLVLSESSVMKIGKDGSFWIHDETSSSIVNALFGQNDTVYLLTESKFIVLYRPAEPLPNEYLIAMISMDLLIGLGSVLWTADYFFKKPD